MRLARGSFLLVNFSISEFFFPKADRSEWRPEPVAERVSSVPVANVLESLLSNVSCPGISVAAFSAARAYSKEDP